jgi:hypothetical protein
MVHARATVCPSHMFRSARITNFASNYGATRRNATSNGAAVLQPVNTRQLSMRTALVSTDMSN